MTTPDTIPSLGAALARLTVLELATFVARMTGLAADFTLTDRARVGDVFGALMLVGADEQDCRWHMLENLQTEIEGDEMGALLDTEPPDLDDLDEHGR